MRKEGGKDGRINIVGEERRVRVREREREKAWPARRGRERREINMETIELKTINICDRAILVNFHLCSIIPASHVLLPLRCGVQLNETKRSK